MLPTSKEVRILIHFPLSILWADSMLAGWAALSDIILAIYPVIVFWNLKISLRIKAGLCLLMAGGLVAAAAGIVKTVNLKFISASHDITCT